MTWCLNRDVLPGSGGAGLIKASDAPYKVPPNDPGGMIVEGQGDTVYAAGAGGDPGGTIDLTAIPEEPIARGPGAADTAASQPRSEEHTSELQSLMRISYAVFCSKKKKNPT